MGQSDIQSACPVCNLFRKHPTVTAPQDAWKRQAPFDGRPMISVPSLLLNAKCDTSILKINGVKFDSQQEVDARNVFVPVNRQKSV